jgi:hypothetical protein
MVDDAGKNVYTAVVDTISSYNRSDNLLLGEVVPRVIPDFSDDDQMTIAISSEVDPHDADTVSYGAQKAHRLAGMAWHNIFAIEPPYDAKAIQAG